ncbi:hypothetical protein DH2020_015273 [Rehmannia glutinosa]|uniref:Uncharacterized protein n=1 Tax=Rehmannia glutinosa TaxID=99300 RepID=A0ABR0WTQ7_REHGL
MSEEEDCPSPNIPRNIQIPEMNMANVPQVPKAPKKDLKSIITKASKQFQGQKSTKPQKSEKTEVKSGLTKEEALEEINKMQKDILALQTVKEFVKSSYESGLAKYWGIENQIMELQQKVSKLQDEFNMDSVIEDDEARTLMAEAALRSCQETLAMLQEKQEKATREAKEEYKRIEVACQRLQSLRQWYLQNRADDKTTEDEEGESKIPSNEVADLIQESKGIEILPENTKESLDLSSVANLTVTQLAEKIDQLVNKVIGLETAVSSQTVLVNTLRTETDDLNSQIRNLEEEKENMIDNTQNLSTRVKEMEGKLNKIQDLNKNVESQSSNLETNFAEARSNLDHLSEKLSSVKPDKEIEKTDSSRQEDTSLSADNSQEEIKDQTDVPSLDESIKSSKTDDTEYVKEVDIDIQVSDQSVSTQGEVNESIVKSGTLLEEKRKEEVFKDHRSYDRVNREEEEKAENDDLNWQQMLLSGMEDREKILLTEYTTILRNYKDMKKKLGEKEKKEKDSQFDITLQMRELKKAITKRDEEIQYLRDVKEDTARLSSSDRDVKSETRNEDLDLDSTKTLRTFRQKRRRRNQVDFHRSNSVHLESRRQAADGYRCDTRREPRFLVKIQHRIPSGTEIQDRGSRSTGRNIETPRKKKTRREFYDADKIGGPADLQALERDTERTNGVVRAKRVPQRRAKTEIRVSGIQEEITKALREGVEEDEIRFSSHQAAKFQGEILNMKQENNKVREELQAGFDHVRMLQLQIEKTIRILNEEFGISADQPESRPRVPKKQKHSIFSCMHPNRRYQVLRTGIRLSSHSSS